jgi:hypothetical protein
VGLLPHACWDCWSVSLSEHGCLSVVSGVCCQVKVSATSWSLVQRNPTECGVSECYLETSTMRRSWLTRAVAPWRQRNYIRKYRNTSIFIVDRLRAGRSEVWISAGARSLPDRLWGTPSLLFNGYRGPFPGVWRRVRDVHSIAEVKKEWSYTTNSLLYAFIVWTGTILHSPVWCWSYVSLNARKIKMNWKGCEKKARWHVFRWYADFWEGIKKLVKSSVRIASRRAEVGSQDFQNIRQNCHPLKNSIRRSL